jgi:hypothetical protein
MASDNAQLGRAGVAVLPRSKSQAQISLRRHECVEPLRGSRPLVASLRAHLADSFARLASSPSVPREISRCGLRPLNILCWPARGRRGGGFEYHASILPESVRLSIHQHELQFAAGPANAVPAAASSPLQTATAPGRDLSRAKRDSFVTLAGHPPLRGEGLGILFTSFENGAVVDSQDWRRTCAGASRGTCGAAQDWTGGDRAGRRAFRRRRTRHAAFGDSIATGSAGEPYVKGFKIS